MVKPLRLGTALTAIGMIGALSACATSGSRIPDRASIFGDKVDKSNIGLATRAQAALEKGDYASAVELAERAVGNTANDAGFRALLGNVYFAAGRFASAESAYRDSLSLLPAQPQVALKLALVTIAQGKRDAAMAVLDGAREMLDPSDYGLALALAGQPQAALGVLDPAARAVGADSRVRQNLALAYALAGNWEQARAVAAQDVAPDQVDARIQQWMTFAQPARASDQVASLTGVTPAAVDPGQPVRLALSRADVPRLAEAVPVVAPAPVAEAAPPMVAQSFAAPSPVVEQAYAGPVPGPQYTAEPSPPMVEQVYAAPVPVADNAAEPIAVAPQPAAVITAAAPVAVIEQVRAMAEAVSRPMVEASLAVPRPALSPRAARLSDVPVPVRKAALSRASGNSRSVVQLGAYASRSGVALAWSRASARYPALRGYSPGTARFESTRGTVYRLSVSGFGSGGQARDLCMALKRSGGQCFVRETAGDLPVRLASL